MKLFRFWTFTRVLLLVSVAAASGQSLQNNDLLAICGDSITEQQIYSVYVEDYLFACQPAADLRAIQFGWGGETSWGFLTRMDYDVVPVKPTVVTTFYGMNDGGYHELPDDRAANYRKSMGEIVDHFKAAGARFIVVGSPSSVDTFYFHNPERAVIYNKSLAQLRDIAREVAQQKGVVFADVYDTTYLAMQKAKAKYGEKYAFGGGDGVHASPAGHLVIAYAFLKALGCDGDIGTFTIDLAADSATATDGHKILSCKSGVVEIESTRYPFCFFGKPDSIQATSGIIEFFPFNDDLNRLMLVVKNTKVDRYKITWGNDSKEFTAAELNKGVNLAAEFIPNPFNAEFNHINDAVKKKQREQGVTYKKLVHELPTYLSYAPAEKDALERVHQRLIEAEAQHRGDPATTVVPVKHTIKIEPVQ